MSFASFIGQVLKMGVGYLGGFVLFFSGTMAYGQGFQVIGGLMAVAGAILFLFGIYTQREM